MKQLSETEKLWGLLKNTLFLVINRISICVTTEKSPLYFMSLFFLAKGA